MVRYTKQYLPYLTKWNTIILYKPVRIMKYMAAEWEKRIMGDGKKMKEIHQEFLTGERALFQGKDLKNL